MKRKEPQPKPKSPELDELWSQVQVAMEQALDLKEAEKIEERRGKILFAFLRGELDLTTSNEQDKEIAREENNIVYFPNLEALQATLMRLLGDEEEARELYLHEEKHFKKARELDFPELAYVLRFFKQGEKRWFRPGIEFKLPEDRDEDLVRTQIYKILEAVDDPSDTDQQTLNTKKN